MQAYHLTKIYLKSPPTHKIILLLKLRFIKRARRSKIPSKFTESPLFEQKLNSLSHAFCHSYSFFHFCGFLSPHEKYIAYEFYLFVDGQLLILESFLSCARLSRRRIYTCLNESPVILHHCKSRHNSFDETVSSKWNNQQTCLHLSCTAT